MKSGDALSYLKIFGGILMPSPLTFAFFRLDYSIKESVLITALLYVVMMVIAIPMYNYLQHGINNYKHE